MASEKVSLTLDEELVAEAREQAGARGFSAYLNEALRLQLQRDRLRRLLDEMDEEFGPVDPKVTAEVEREWHAGGKRTPKRRVA